MAGMFFGGSVTIAGSAGSGTSTASMSVRKLTVSDSYGNVVLLVDGGSGLYAAQFLSNITVGGFMNSRNQAWKDQVSVGNAAYTFYFLIQSLFQGEGPFSVVAEFNNIASFTGYTTAPTGVTGVFNYTMLASDALGPGFCLESHTMTNIANSITGRDVIAFELATSQGTLQSLISALTFAGFSYSTDQITVISGLGFLGNNAGANTNGTQGTIPAGGPQPFASAAIAGQLYSSSPHPGPISITFNQSTQLGIAMLRTTPISGGYFGSPQ
jgi:hypothetical protein